MGKGPIDGNLDARRSAPHNRAERGKHLDPKGFPGEASVSLETGSHDEIVARGVFPLLPRLAQPVLGPGSIGRSPLVLLAALSCLALVLGCRSPLKPREVCLLIEAGPSLNLYDGEAHALNLLIFPLTGPAAFREASVDDLVSGRGIDGAAGAAISVMLSPGEIREVREAFPPATTSVGLVANYYRGSFEKAGNRRAIVAGRCSWFRGDKIMLTARDLLVD